MRSIFDQTRTPLENFVSQWDELRILIDTRDQIKL